MSNIYNRSNPPLGFYVYAYLREHDSKTAKAGTPFYIGKGKGQRIYGKHKVAIPSNKSNILLLAENLSDEKAKDYERALIWYFGRVDLGNGILRNLTEGGDSGPGRPKGCVVTDKHRNKLSTAKKGKSWQEIYGQEGAEIRRRQNSQQRGPMAKERKRNISQSTADKIRWEYYL